MTIPRSPAPAIGKPPAAQDVAKVLESALTGTIEIVPPGSQERYALIRELDSGARNPRVGLRRWIAQISPVNDPDRKSDFIVVELHHDGSVSFAVALKDWNQELLENRYPVMVALVESFVVDFIALSETYARHLGEQIPIGARIDLVRADISKPFATIDQDRMGQFTTGKLVQPSWSRTLRRFKPVIAEIPSAADTDTLRTVARELAQDILHQFDIANLLFL